VVLLEVDNDKTLQYKLLPLKGGIALHNKKFATLGEFNAWLHADAMREGSYLSVEIAGTESYSGEQKRAVRARCTRMVHLAFLPTPTELAERNLVAFDRNMGTLEAFENYYKTVKNGSTPTPRMLAWVKQAIDQQAENQATA